VPVLPSTDGSTQGAVGANLQRLPIAMKPRKCLTVEERIERYCAAEKMLSEYS